MDQTSPSNTGVTAPERVDLGDVRSRVLADHARLKTIIAQVDRLALAVASADLQQLGTLRERAGELYRMLVEHIDHEDAILAPIIRQIDAWGLVRYEQMQRDHASQRKGLELAVHELDLEGPSVGHSVQSMCWEILHDMKREEHDLLHPDLWRDDRRG